MSIKGKIKLDLYNDGEKIETVKFKLDMMQPWSDLLFNQMPEMLTSFENKSYNYPIQQEDLNVIRRESHKQLFKPLVDHRVNRKRKTIATGS